MSTTLYCWACEEGAGGFDGQIEWLDDGADYRVTDPEDGQCPICGSERLFLERFDPDEYLSDWWWE